MADKQSEINTYHQNAKNAGNRLSAYVTNSCIGAVAVFFLALVNHGQNYNGLEKVMLIVALLAFVVATFLRFLELHFDAKRFYQLAIQNAKQEHEQDWTVADRFKRNRLNTIWLSYISFAIGVAASVVFLIARVVQ